MTARVGVVSEMTFFDRLASRPTLRSDLQRLPSALIRTHRVRSFFHRPPLAAGMLFYWLLFFFLAFGSKVLLAFVMIYLLLPNDRSCSHCDEETLLIRANRIGRIGFAVSFGRVQWRWCPRCGWEGLARRIPTPPPNPKPPVRRPLHTRS